MNVVICEFMDEQAVQRLREQHSVSYDPSLVDDPPRLLGQGATADALIVRNRTQVRGELLAVLGRCRVVGRLGVGLDNIDVAGCEEKGIRVVPATGANALSVAEYVVATAIVLLRGAYLSTAEVAAGKWPRQRLGEGREAAGKTLGLVGFGAIGQLTARLARSLGFNVIGFDAMLDADHPAYASTGARCAGLEEVITTADVVSLHVPLVDSTRGMFDAARIDSMKPGAVLLTPARGGIVDEAALAAALRKGHLGGAAIDVFAAEPLPRSAHFEGCPNLILTPHIAGVSADSNARVSALIAERVLEVLG